MQSAANIIGMVNNSNITPIITKSDDLINPVNTSKK